MRDEALDKLRWSAYYDRGNEVRDGFPKSVIDQYLRSGEMELLLAILKQVVQDWSAMVRKASGECGLKVCRVADLLQWPRTPMVRFMAGKTNKVPLSAVVAVADLYGTTVERLYYKQSIHPLVLPRKHMAWICRLRGLPKDVRIAIKVLLSQELPSGQAPVTSMDYAGLVGRRLIEYADEAGIRLEDLGRERGLILNQQHRHSLQNTGASQTFLGGTAKILLFGIMAGCALDYYLRWDYSGYTGRFADRDGNEVALDRPEREILSILLRCGDPEKEAYGIGRLCAVAEDWPRDKKIWLHA